MPRERSPLVDEPGERPGEALGGAREAHGETARAMDAVAVHSVRTVVVPVLGRLLGEDVRLEGSGYEDGDANAERSDLFRQGFGPPFERPLGGGVGTDRRHAPDGTHTRYDNDPAAPSGPHGRQQLLGELYRSEQVGAEQPFPHLGRRLLHRSRGGDPGVVNDDVGGTDGFLYGLGGSADR